MEKRVLVSGGPPEVLTAKIWRQYQGGSPYVRATFDSVQESASKRTVGFNIPNYHKLKNSGALLPMTPFDQFAVEASASGSHSYSWNVPPNTPFTEWNEGHYLPFDRLGDIWLITEDELDTLMQGLDPNYYVQSAAAKIYSSGWDALTFVAELTKTVAMFRGFVTNLVSNLAKNNYDKIWLEARYGWRTLYYDMKDIEAAISNINEGRLRYRESAGRTSHDITTTDHVQVWGSATNTYFQADRITVGERGTVIADMEPPRVSFNPIVTGYELITFSFVLDWVVNVGQWLQAMSFLTFSSKYVAAGGLYCHVRRTLDLSTTVWNPGNSGAYTQSCTCEAEKTLRIPQTIPTRPLFNLRLDLAKILDLTALLSQIIKTIR